MAAQRASPCGGPQSRSHKPRSGVRRVLTQTRLGQEGWSSIAPWAHAGWLFRGSATIGSARWPRVTPWWFPCRSHQGRLAASAGPRSHESAPLPQPVPRPTWYPPPDGSVRVSDTGLGPPGKGTKRMQITHDQARQEPLTSPPSPGDVLAYLRLTGCQAPGSPPPPFVQ